MDKNKKIMIGSLTTLGVGIVTASTLLGITLANKDKNDPNLLKGETLHSKRLDLANNVLKDLWAKGIRFEMTHLNQPIMKSIDDKVTFTNDPSRKIQTSFDNFIVQLKSTNNKLKLDQIHKNQINDNPIVIKDNNNYIQQQQSEERTQLDEDSFRTTLAETYLNKFKANFSDITNGADLPFQGLNSTDPNSKDPTAQQAILDAISTYKTTPNYSNFLALDETIYKYGWYMGAFDSGEALNWNANVTSIGNSAFWTSKLTSLSLPKVTSIRDSAFTLSKLTSLSLPKVTSIGESAFESSTLTTLSLPNVTSIGEHAFGWSRLYSLSLPKMTSIKPYTFESLMVTHLNLPKFTNLNSWYILKDSISRDATITIKSLISRDYIKSIKPKDMTWTIILDLKTTNEIKQAWIEYTNTFPKLHPLLGTDPSGDIKTTYITSLNNLNAYITNYQGTNVNEEEFTNLLHTLETARSAYNTKIDEINAPFIQQQQSEERTKIDSSHFTTTLAETYLNKFKANFIDITNGADLPFHGLNSIGTKQNDQIAQQAILDAISTYKTTPNYNNFLTLDETIYKYGWYMGILDSPEVSHWNTKSTSIGYVFRLSLFTSLSLPNITAIRDGAFSYSKLTSLSLPKVETIGGAAFSDSKLTSLSLPKVTSIGRNAFGDSELTSLSLPKVTSIGRNAFGDSTLTSLSLPKVTSIGESAFESSTLTTLSLPKVTSIGESAFESSTLTTLSLPKVTSIGRDAFQYSTLTSLSLPDVTSIGVYAFSDSKLTSLSLPKVTSIGRDAFSSSKLTSLSLPNLIDNDSWDHLKDSIQNNATIIVKDQATKGYVTSIKPDDKTWTINIFDPFTTQPDPAPRPDPISKPINPTPTTIDPLRNNFNLNLMDIYIII